MKKMLTMILALMMLVAAIPAQADEPEMLNPLPEDIAALFDVPAWKEYHVMVDATGRASWTYSEELDAGVVVMTNGSLHIVCLIEPNSKGELRITQRNYTMVVGDTVPHVGTGWGNLAQEIEQPWGTKLMFEIQTGEYMIVFGKFNNGWRVKEVLNESWISFVFNDRIGYRDGEIMGDYIDYESNPMMYAYGTYDNRFAAFNIYTFPQSVKEAREKLTNPPVTPTDFYTPVTLTLRANEKYDVFAAPGRDSYRAADGKAVMSTNDWVQVFGEEDGWLLVQYDISRDQMRFGYIDASALPRDTEVQTLTWYDLPEQTIKYGATVTDDPLVSCGVIHHLSSGDRVRVLSAFGSWYYIETTDASGKLLRGFVPKSCIDIVTDDELVG